MAAADVAPRRPNRIPPCGRLWLAFERSHLSLHLRESCQVHDKDGSICRPSCIRMSSARNRRLAAPLRQTQALSDLARTNRGFQVEHRGLNLAQSRCATMRRFRSKDSTLPECVSREEFFRAEACLG